MASWKSVTAAADYVTRRLPRSRPSHRRRPDHGGRDGCRRHPRPATHGERTIERCGHEAGQGNEESCGNGGGGGKRGNPRAGFPLFPPLLGNLAKAARFPHSHSSADEAVEKWKTKSRFPTFPPPSLGF